jgi:myosin heavy subunit
VPEGTPPTVDSAAPPSDETVVNGPTFLTDLPNAVTRAVARVRGSQLPSTTPNADPPQQPVRTPRERADDAFLHLEPSSQAELEQKLASLTATFQQAERRHAAAMTAAQTAHELAATEQLTEQERQFHVQIALEREQRRTVEEMLSAAMIAREEVERRIASALADADAHVRDLQQRHDAALAKAAGELAEQRTHLDRELSRAALEGGQLRERLIETELALEQTRHDHESAAADVARLEASFEAQLTSKRLDYENRLAEIQSECGRLAEAGAAATEDVQRLNANLSDARRVLEDTQREYQDTLGRQSTEHRMALAALGVTLAERDERLKEETARHDAALQASERTRTELQECLQAALAAGRHDIDQIQQTLLAALEGVRAATRRQDTLQAQADRIAESHEAPDGSRAPNTREPRQPEIAVWQELSKDAALV